MIDAKYIHFVGIGGIGMSALAQLLASEGKVITGSDRDPSPKVHALLEKKNITVFVGHDPAYVRDAQLVVYSDAVPESNPEREEALKRIPRMNYFEALGEVSKEKRTIAVAGTHGKTTTTGMLGKILIDAGIDPTIIVGSLVKDFGGNYVKGASEWFVVEACEYKRHFLHLTPSYLIITNLEWDHTDYFESFDEVQAAFVELIARVAGGGAIITNTNDLNIAPLIKDVQAQVIDYRQEDVPELQLLGEFNKQNARAAKTLATLGPFDISKEACDTSLQSFHGSWRRFEYKGRTKNGAEVYDDYAHHPSAIHTTLAAIKQRFPDKKLVTAFHPHLYSRTKDLFDQFVSSFHDADEVLVAPIFAAREAPREDVSSELLANAIEQGGTKASAYTSLDDVESALAQKEADTLIVTMGAGDIYKVADSLTRNT